jgi:hypothetical protein
MFGKCFSCNQTGLTKRAAPAMATSFLGNAHWPAADAHGTPDIFKHVGPGAATKDVVPFKLAAPASRVTPPQSMEATTSL